MDYWRLRVHNSVFGIPGKYKFTDLLLTFHLTQKLMQNCQKTIKSQNKENMSQARMLLLHDMAICKSFVQARYIEVLIWMDSSAGEYLAIVSSKAILSGRAPKHGHLSDRIFLAGASFYGYSVPRPSHGHVLQNPGFAQSSILGTNENATKFL